MHDIRFIRENPDAFDRALSAARTAEARAQRLIALDEKRRAKILALETAQARRNAASKEIGEAKKNKDEEKAKELDERSRCAQGNRSPRWRWSEKKRRRN